MKPEYNRFNVVHVGICGLVSAVASIVVSGGHGNAILSFLVMTYFIFGNTKYGAEKLTSWSGLKSALIVSAIWPYLAWKKLGRTFKNPSSVIYDAYVNDVFVGALSDTEYSAIIRQVFNDYRVYVAQLLNVVWIAFKTLDSFLIGVPVLAFWMLLYFAYFEPTLYSNVIATIQQGPVAIHAAVEQYVLLLVLLWILTLLVQTVVFLRVPGFQNKFDQAATKLLRQKLKVAAEGKVILLPQVASFVMHSE